MGAISYSDAIAIAQIVYYAPAILACVYLCARHGFTRSSGWILLVIFCLLRIIGASALLSTINNSGSTTALTIALICSVMGTSPLLLASLGLLSRIYYSILAQVWSTFFQVFVLRIIQIPALVALILCIVGATSASNPTQIESEETVHIGIILFLVVFIMLVIMTVIAIICIKKVPDQERVLVKAVALALPFMFVHIVYSLLVAFSHNSDFNLVYGSKTIFLCMSVIEEMVIVLFYIYAGLRARSTPLPQDASPTRTIGYRAGRSDFGGGRLGLVSLGFGVANAVGNRGDKNSRRHQSSDSGV